MEAHLEYFSLSLSLTFSLKILSRYSTWKIFFFICFRTNLLYFVLPFSWKWIYNEFLFWYLFNSQFVLLTFSLNSLNLKCDELWYQNDKFNWNFQIFTVSRIFQKIVFLILKWLISNCKIFLKCWCMKLGNNF